ncbi:MAG: LacI family DNA-binding transcriptional regulator [Bacilli bacterium]|jgi:LacI family transcriptional regulator|nr:LacI family transcriptional regulator [Acholeplasmataceae bacterium]
MRRKGNVRLIDIAREVGCTVNTVSRALRNKDDISEKTKKKVREVANRLGYIPNSIASSLRSGLSYTVAIIFENLINPYYMIMTDKLHRRLEELGYATLIFAVHDYTFKSEALSPIISRKVDGLITFLEPTEETIALCAKNNIASLLLGRKNTKLRIDSIATDDYSGGFKAGELLIARGVKNVGYIGAPEAIECSVRRQRGLRDAFLKHGLPYDEDNVRYMNGNDLKKEIEALLENGANGIFFFNDVMAYEGIRYLNSKNIRIPEDIKIVGYDDIAHDFPVPISLATVSSDKDRIVNTAVDILYKKMRGLDCKNDIKIIDFDVNIKEGSTV